ncbi:MAG: extracellular solute-binding protein [Clostridia bacterium]|nr:extracellular solute-binding protein [Clostridia bacterium]
MKKVLALCLSLIMIFGCLAGCGGSADPNKEVTLTWVMGCSQPKEVEKVLDKANGMLEELLPNTKISFVMDSSMASKWSLWMAGRKVFDIAHAGFYTDIQTEINNGAYTPLDDLIEEYAPTIKELKNGIFKDLFDYGVYAGETYAIPCIQTYCKESLTVSIPAALKQYIDVDRLVKTAYASSTTTDEFYQILDDYLQASKKAGAIGNEKISNYINPEFTYDFAKRGYEFIGGEYSSVAYKLDPKKIEVVDFHETEEFKTYIKWMSKWNKEGFVSPDVLTGGSSSKMYLIESHKVERKGEEANHTRTAYAMDYAQDRLSIFVTNPEFDYKGAPELGKLQTFLAIPTTSKAPERAMQFLELIYSEKGKDLINLLTFGIEGEQYEKVSDNAIKCFEYQAQPSGNISYGIAAWTMGNMFNMYAIYPYDESTIEYARDYWENTNKNRPLSAAYGLFFDANEHTKILSDMSTVNQEYELQLTCGVYENYTELYNTMISLNKKAGIEKLIDTLQKQANEHLKK